MGKVLLHSSVSAMTFASSGAKTPGASNNGKLETVVSDAESAAFHSWTSRPKVVRSLPNGDVVIQLPVGLLTSITISGTAYTPDAAHQITVPAAAATAFLESIKYSS